MSWPSLETLPPVDLAHIGDFSPWKSFTRLSRKPTKRQTKN